MGHIYATIGDTLTQQVTATLKNAYNAANNVADPLLQKVYAAATQVHNALVAAGLGEPAASFATYQVYHETGAFTSELYKKHDNDSGIKYAGQKGATKGANGYSYFNSVAAWAAAMKHELTKGSNPAGAITLEDYVKRLKANKYFGDSVSNYLSGLKRARLVLKILPAADRAGNDAGTIQQRADLDIPGSHDYSKDPTGIMDKFNALPMWAKVGVGAVGLIMVVRVIE